MKPVGKLDYYYAHVVSHSDENFTEVFRVLLLVGSIADFVELGNAVYESKNFVAEFFAYVVRGGVGILDYVVQEGRGYGRGVHTEVYKYFRNCAGMRKIRLARGTLLPVMHKLGIAVRGEQNASVLFGIFVKFFKYRTHKFTFDTML